MQDENTLREVAKDCVHCGFCLPACPTYQLWAEEMDSPRGRIHLVNQILDGAPLFRYRRGALRPLPGVHGLHDRVSLGRPVRPAHRGGPGVDRGGANRGACRRVRYAAGPAAVSAAGAAPRTVRERVARAAIFSLFPYPRRLRALTAPLRTAQRTGLHRKLARSGLPGRVSPVLGAALRLAPPGVSAAAARPLPQRVPALGTRRAVVGMLTGCVQSVFFPQVNAATARVLAAEGCDVIVPRGQGCCGALSLHSGREAEAAAFARRTIALFEQAGVDAVVVNSAGCGSAMKEYGRLLGRADAGWAERAAEMSARVRDLAEFLAEIGPVARRHPLPVTAAYHDACHLAHAQRITKEPRDLLRAIPELNLVEVPDAGTCCGSAGVYNLLQPARPANWAPARPNRCWPPARRCSSRPIPAARCRSRPPWPPRRAHRGRAHRRGPGRLHPRPPALRPGCPGP